MAAVASVRADAHPGHEPEDFLHAVAHELASPRGILALIILSIAAGLWLYSKNQKSSL
jgi:hypothetical protein